MRYQSRQNEGRGIFFWGGGGGGQANKSLAKRLLQVYGPFLHHVLCAGGDPRDGWEAGGRQWSWGREGKGTLSSGMMKAQGGGNGPAEGKGRELYPQG